jgi:hypothetical protein
VHLLDKKIFILIKMHGRTTIKMFELISLGCVWLGLERFSLVSLQLVVGLTFGFFAFVATAFSLDVSSIPSAHRPATDSL